MNTSFKTLSNIIIQQQRLFDLFVIGTIENYFKKLSSDGCEIWYYHNDVGWEQSVGNKEKSLIKSGFNNSNNFELTLLTPFQTRNGTRYLYAGTWNPKQGCEIWRTTDPLHVTWEPIVHSKGFNFQSSGFGNKNNTAAYTAATLGNWLYIGTMNWENGCEIWRTNGEKWEPVVGGMAPISNIPNGFADNNRYFNRNIYAWDMCVYNDSHGENLYVGTFNIAGCELWKTKNGITWHCLVGNQGTMKRGFTQVNMPLRILNYGIRQMKVYNNSLFIGTASVPSFHLNLYDIESRYHYHMSKIIEIPSKGFEIWKYNGNDFTKVVGKRSRDENTNLGFNDRTNAYCWSMEAYNGCLFVGTMNPGAYVFNLSDKWENLIQCNISFEFTNNHCHFNAGGGCEIWYTDDGSHWQQMIGNEVTYSNDDTLGNGFDDHNNVGARALITYNDKLYVGVMNGKEGCEVWCFDGSKYPKENLIKMEPISFESNGYTLYGEIYYPNSEKPSFPALVFCEGLPAYISAYDWLARSLVEKGYAIIMFDPPGLGRSEGVLNLKNLSFPQLNLFFRFGSYAETPYHYFLRHWVTATSDALDFLITNSTIKNRINAEKIGIIGHSLGGITATEAAAKDKRFKAIVALSHGNPIIMKKITVPIQFICAEFDIGLFSKPISLYCYKKASVPKEFILLRFGNHIGFTTAFGPFCPCPSWQKEMILHYAAGWFNYFMLNKPGSYNSITSPTAYLSQSILSRYNFNGEDIILNKRLSLT